MSRVTFDISVLDKRDLITGRQLCRTCGGPIPKGSMKRYYCSDKCSNIVYNNFGWGATRNIVWKRDVGKCQVCGCYVKKGQHDEWLLKRIDPTFEGFPKGLKRPSAHCHHVTPVEYLLNHVWNLHVEWFPQWEHHDTRWQREFNRSWIIVYTDINNLITLCETCHKKVHAKQYLHSPELCDLANFKILELWAKSKIDPWAVKDPEIIKELQDPPNTMFNYLGDSHEKT